MIPRPDDNDKLKRFHIKIGEKIAYIEIISLTNSICAVEIDGQEPIFITKIRDKNNKPSWISIPQGNDELAESVGKYVDDLLHFNK
jgi:hypothetical protein